MNKCILIVDDNAISLKLLHAIFEGDYEVKTANDGLEALEILLQNKIDLVITDVLMPNMDGYHLCYKIRTNPRLTDIPVVIYTATYVSLSEAKVAMEMGASYYLRKPAASQLLRSTVKVILDNQKAFPHKIPTRQDSMGMMQQYSAKLIAKLEQSNIELEAAKNRLEHSEKYFRALIENSADAIVLNDENFILLYESPSVTRILGYTAQERKGKRTIDYVYPDDRSKIEDVYKEATANPGIPTPFQNRFKHSDGHYVWLEGTLTNLLGDPVVHAYVANYRDITKRKKTEDDLARVLRKFEQAQQIAHLGNFEVDLATSKISWSAEMFRIFGIEPFSTEPSEELFLAQIHPEDLERVKAVSPTGLQGLKPFSFHHRIVHPSGQVRHLFTVGRYEYNALGQPATLNGISLDITELAEKETKLQQANQDLATFIYKAYHDLRSPIVSVLGLVNVATSDVKDKTSLKYFNMISGVAEKQNRMLLSLISVMEIRDRVPVMTTVNLGDLLNDVLDSLKGIRGYDEIEFKNNCDGEVQTDGELLAKIICSIVENSILYHDVNRVTPEVKISSSTDAQGYLTIEIADNGLGISDEVLPRIYELFFRGSDLSRGSGLGLFMAKNGVEKLGGSISVRSKENVGTTFWINIPTWPYV